MFFLVSLIKYCAAGNRLSKRYITSTESSEAKSEDSIEVQMGKRGTLFKTEQAKQPQKGVCFMFSILIFLLNWREKRCIPEREAAIQSNQMDLDKEEARPEQGLPSIPQERHIWRMP
ncbi:hypothetical protein O181_001787 [Austropuccinia psidii MF-1]|uniref:Uncharacterized protein n=1 Tax=Austropuccinia psidii MF-1 TaxID=1389203 RepID=A0A9Q3GDE2_9BASI|nr:hypothetical protein [Austropuccinia psidii MF-1]